MATQTIAVLKYPHPKLRLPSSDATLTEAKQIIKYLHQASHTQSWGRVLGFAAPQIGINKRVFLAFGEPFINPEIVAVDDKKLMHLEGCYSLKDNKFDYRVYRPRAIRMAWTAEDGTQHDKWFTGLKAQVLQHEYDHLEGKLCNGSNAQENL